MYRIQDGVWHYLLDTGWSTAEPQQDSVELSLGWFFTMNIKKNTEMQHSRITFCWSSFGNQNQNQNLLGCIFDQSFGSSKSLEFIAIFQWDCDGSCVCFHFFVCDSSDGKWHLELIRMAMVLKWPPSTSFSSFRWVGWSWWPHMTTNYWLYCFHHFVTIQLSKSFRFAHRWPPSFCWTWL